MTCSPVEPAWVHRPPPPPDPDVLAVWAWELHAAVDLTVSRRRLGAEAYGLGRPATEMEEDIERLLLAYEELASNGFRHGRAPVRAQVTASPRGWLIDVTDAAPETSPVPAVDRDPALGGLGMHLIARLSDAHGWSVEGGRKHVWAYLGATRA